VPKILVADDNSNVQKTVALALADLGVEVVAVNNGDAAVRKLGDIMPDLVLADIFMPVRNGYEVCDFVKRDPRFSHVPVVLLVGAFDPLDEREAQRVAADGILKKPFVPPDPLIAMVKTLLDRSLGERLVAVGASKTEAAAQNSATAVKVEERPRPPVPPPAPAAPMPAIEMAPEEEFQAPVNHLSLGGAEAPIAFGQLLDSAAQGSATAETEAIEPVDDDQVLTSSRDATLGEPAFWKTEDPEPETTEGEAEAEAEDDADFSSRAWGLEEEDAPARSSHAGSVQAVEPIEEPVEPFELVRDEDASAAPTIVEAVPSFVQDAASQASLTVEAGKAADLAANPIEWMATAPPPPAEEVEEEPETPWNAADLETTEHADASEEPAEEPMEELHASAEPVPTPAPTAPASPLGVMAPASFLGMSVPSATPPAAPPAPPQTKAAAPASDPLKTQPPFKSLTQSAEDTARSIPKQDWADLAASLQASPVVPATPVAEKPKTTAPAPPPAAVSAAVPETSTATPPSAAPADPAEPDPALVEAVVQRVLDKMRPQVVDIITKEFLRPVVQALVHREINKH
jgi:CheY-like chemotaxis protein